MGNEEEGGLGAVVTDYRAIPSRRIPTVHLLDTSDGTVSSLAHLGLVAGSTLGGTYAYLDNRNRVSIIDGSRYLKFVAWRNSGNGKEVFVADNYDLTTLIDDGDNSVGIVPSWTGETWFATKDGYAGYYDYDPTTKTGARVRLNEFNPDGEQVANTIASSPAGIAVATTYGLYLLSRQGDNAVITWSAWYDRRTARKPGMLSWGTGSSPTFFGPESGFEYIAIADSHFGDEVNRSNVKVYSVADGSLIAGSS